MKNKTIQKILLEFEPKIENLLPALKKISVAFGYVKEKEARILAGYFSISESKIFETMTFYDDIKTKKPPQILIQVCSSTNCTVNNNFKIIKEIEKKFKIRSGDDNSEKIKLEEISCLGRCAEGPIMVVNGKVYEKVNSSMVHSILGEYL
jgi:NADH:ubiquinone oxidoreductase subunit E